MKPTPPAPEVASMKRTRSASRSSAMKRKVLMDDSMVLLGDTIRQQLTNTEDIRRLRKKAPCTRTEILMIQRQSLDDEIFSEPVLTGMLAELTCLHSETFDVSRIEIAENEVAKDSSRPTVAQDNELETSTEPVICRNDVDGQSAENPIRTENQEGEENQLSSDFVNQGQMNKITDAADHRSSEHETLGEITEMEIDKGNEVADAANHATILQFDGSHAEQISGDAGSMLDVSALMDGNIGVDGSLQMDASILPSDMMDTQLFEEVALRDMSDGKTLDDIEVLDHQTDNVVAVGTGAREGEEILLEESKAGAPLEFKVDFQADGSAPADDADTLLANISSETGGCINLTSVNVDQTQDEVENDKLGGGNEDGGLAVIPGHVDKDQESNHLCNEELKMDFTYPLALDGDFKNASLNDGDYPFCQEADQQRTADAGITYVDHPADLQDVAFANDTVNCKEPFSCYDSDANMELKRKNGQRFEEFRIMVRFDIELIGPYSVDDDEMGEDDDDGMPGPEDARLLDNSGWSSRTRAVAKYLQTIFDNEGANGRKVISVDSLLGGKTRKEASRMFFETLVLKTRDYIQVEQLKPFDSINVKARAKLMKSDF
ncbi:unnamed protein product [Dovyalis caffra]|uniref:Rad21/Rec8-like protein C-terminal eukaryotic domain-containing protein n=1 Tax=Dovyalis caffra TaxID=77055 RepID=A0AAV1QWA6_9ROSI|nr:unnamed protein product [Dovyalis caffra]